MNTYSVGQNVRFFVVFQNIAGAFVDPTTVTFKIRSPETGIIFTFTLPAGPEVVQDSAGHYHSDYTLDYPGDWYYRWEGSGTYIGADEAYVCVRDTVF